MKQTKPATMALWGVALLAMIAGVAGGLVLSRMNAGRTVRTSEASHGDAFAEALHLSDQQRNQMRVIWESTRTTAQSTAQEAQDAQHDRDNAVFSLLSSDQKLQYDRLTKQCAQKIYALKSKRDEAVKTAVNQTRQILSSEQRQQYEAMVRERLGKAAPDITASEDGALPPVAQAN